MRDLGVCERHRPESVEGAEAVSARLRNADAEGFTALDISCPSSPGASLSILVHGSWCVIHYFPAPAQPPQLLENPDPEDAPAEVLFRYVDELTAFTRPFIHPLATASRCIHEFGDDDKAGHRPVGEWADL